MMKTTQLLTNKKLWQNMCFVMLFLFGFSINGQEVGEDLMIPTNGGLSTTEVDPTYVLTALVMVLLFFQRGGVQHKG
jgi:hypothetical protein